MEISKDQVLEFLKERGDSEQATQAQEELPDQVDTDSRRTAMTETARELFEHELRDIYDAEHKLIKALEKMAKDASDDQLSNAFNEHREVTQQQARRLERVFQLIDRAPRREPCAGINGLIEEYQKFNKEEDPSPEVRDVFAVGAALKVESYEISSYKSLIKLANQLGLIEAASLFEDSLREEQEAAREVEEMSEILGKKLS